MKDIENWEFIALPLAIKSYVRKNKFRDINMVENAIINEVIRLA